MMNVIPTKYFTNGLNIISKFQITNTFSDFDHKYSINYLYTKNVIDNITLFDYCAFIAVLTRFN